MRYCNNQLTDTTWPANGNCMQSFCTNSTSSGGHSSSQVNEPSKQNAMRPLDDVVFCWNVVRSSTEQNGA